MFPSPPDGPCPFDAFFHGDVLLLHKFRHLMMDHPGWRLKGLEISPGFMVKATSVKTLYCFWVTKPMSPPRLPLTCLL